MSATLRSPVIGVAELAKALVGQPDDVPDDVPDELPLVVDCRFDLADSGAGEAAWARETIAGAAYAHLNRDLSGEIVAGVTGRHPLPVPQRAATQLAAIGIATGRAVVAFDDSGGCYAARLWWMLRWLGHDRVQVLDGGWSAWVQSQGARAPGERHAPGEFAAHVRPEMAIDAGTLALLREGLRLVDARAPERFSGAVEPLDAAAGHIPGASNLPWKANLDAHGMMRSPVELKARFEALFAGHAPQEIVNYCGSGVTACHNLLAMQHAALYGAKLFPGSWSEWIVDPLRPRAPAT